MSLPVVRRCWAGVPPPRDFSGFDPTFPFLSPWHGETPQVVSHQSLCLRYFHASLVPWVTLRSSFQAEVLTNWWRRLWHLHRRSERRRILRRRRRRSEMGFGNPENLHRKRQQIFFFSPLGLSLISCWFWSHPIKDPEGWPWMCWAAWGKLGLQPPESFQKWRSDFPSAPDLPCKFLTLAANPLNKNQEQMHKKNQE